MSHQTHKKISSLATVKSIMHFTKLKAVCMKIFTAYLIKVRLYKKSATRKRAAP